MDPLFEFDAPQAFVDLSAPCSYASDSHDAWFDKVHPQHSKPSAELAKELQKIRKKRRSSVGKENMRPDVRELLKQQNKEIQSRRQASSLKENRHQALSAKKTAPSLKESRKILEPFQGKRKWEETTRKPLATLDENTERGAHVKQVVKKKSGRSVQELLARHNKKFKATHTYEPPQHSVREVKQWERETKQSYYALSAEERVRANEEIRTWKQQRAARTL